MKCYGCCSSWKTWIIPYLALVSICSDIKFALALTSNPVNHEHTKHIEIDCHLIREKLQTGVIHTQHVSTKHQLADIPTKPLRAAHFRSLLLKLGVINIHTPPWGGCYTCIFVLLHYFVFYDLKYNLSKLEYWFVTM